MENTIIFQKEFENRLLDLVNNSHLDIGSAYYIMKNIFRDVEKVYFSSYQEALQNLQKQQEDEEITQIEATSLENDED